MPEYPIRDSILSSLNAQEPWPDNVKLFQPYEVEQILLPDNASCLAVQAFLKMCSLPFEVEMRWNAEFMSPSGRVPFIKCGAFVVSELEPIAQFAANKGISLCSRLSTEEKAEMRAYMSLITNVLVNAELYISWLDNETFNQVTKVRNSSVYPWPLGWFQTRTKRNNITKRLKALHWLDKSLTQVLADVEQCCNSLSQRLGDKDYFFGTPTPLDALVYGHMRALLSARGPKAALMIRPITNALLHHVVRVTTLVEMKLSPQEEYLLQQAFLPRGRSSSARTTTSERSYRTRRSRVSVRHSSKESFVNASVFDAALEDVVPVINEVPESDHDNDNTSSELPEISQNPEVTSNTGYHSADYTDSSNHRRMRGDFLNTVGNSGEIGSLKDFSNKSYTSMRSSRFSSESKATLKLPSDSEISVESLLNYLRKRNATYSSTMPEVDVD